MEGQLKVVWLMGYLSPTRQKLPINIVKSYEDSPFLLPRREMELAARCLPSHNPARKFGSTQRLRQNPGSHRAPRLSQGMVVRLVRDLGGV